MNLGDHRRYFIGSMFSILLVMVTTTAGGRVERKDLFGNYIRHHPTFSSDQKPKTCQIYSRITKKHIQILPRKVVANGEDGDEYALLEKTSITFGVVTIRGKKSRRYLCMSKRGKLLARKKLSRDGSCHFIENITAALWTSYENQKHAKWYIGFNKNKKAKRGRKTRENQEACNFLIRSPDSSDRKVETVPDYMQELLDDLKRRLRIKHGLTRRRRHRLQTEDPIDNPIDDVEEKLPNWARQPPQKASPDAYKREWVIRVENLIKKLGPKSPVPESTQSSYELEMANPTTPKPITRQRGKGRNSPRRSRGGRKSKGNHHPSKARPTSSPSRKKLTREIAVPRTPVRQRDSSPVILTTVSSPSFSKIKDDSTDATDHTEIGVSEPTLRSIERDSLSKRNNNVNTDSTIFSERDHAPRVENPSGSSLHPRRKPRTNRASRKRHRPDA